MTIHDPTPLASSFEMKDIFDPSVTEGLIHRIRALTPDTRPEWGKMNVAQMLAHCSVAYEMVYEDRHPRPNPVLRILLKTFVKRGVVNEKPYPRNSPTAPAFKVSQEQDFERERDRLIAYLERTRDLGPDHFDGRESLSFGPLSRQEWNNLFYKHLDHHLTQFGV
jgi:hypothetical protein